MTDARSGFAAADLGFNRFCSGFSPSVGGSRSEIYRNAAMGLDSGRRISVINISPDINQSITVFFPFFFLKITHINSQRI